MVVYPYYRPIRLGSATLCIYVQGCIEKRIKQCRYWNQQSLSKARFNAPRGSKGYIPTPTPNEMLLISSLASNHFHYCSSWGVELNLGSSLLAGC